MPVVRRHMSRDLLSAEPAERITDVARRMVERASEPCSSSTADGW